MSSRLPIGVATIYNKGDSRKKESKVAPGFEPGMEALQASALPLGYATKIPSHYALTQKSRQHQLFV